MSTGSQACEAAITHQRRARGNRNASKAQATTADGAVSRVSGGVIEGSVGRELSSQKR